MSVLGWADRIRNQHINRESQLINTIKNLGYCCLILIFLISFLMNQNQIDFDLLVVVVTLGILIKKATKKQKFYYSSFIVESLPVFWFLLALNL